MEPGKSLYRATGNYKYNGVYNPVPSDCEYFFAYPSRKRWVLKAMIARHLNLISEQSLYINVSGVTIKIIKKGV